MRNIILLFLLVATAACSNYTDPDPISDPRLTTPYCNDPSAINFNWDFPGVPDNSVCFYPSEVFAGNYIWHDTLLNDNLTPRSFDSSFVTISQLDTTRVKLVGRCSTDLFLTTNKFLNIVIDSVVNNGQIFCRPTDTIVGQGLKIGFADDTKFTIDYTIFSDTGNSVHKATFIKQ